MITPELLTEREQQSIDILALNDRGSHTIPNADLFPHQWSWDSGFVAIALAHTDTERAAAETMGYFERGQWANGMGPNQIVTPGFRYFGDRLNLRSKVNPHAPRDLTTSGISQPPMHAEATWRTGQEMTEDKRLEFFEAMLPNLVGQEQWHEERDFNGTGRKAVIHPYETGMDNSPALLMPIREHFGINPDDSPRFRDRPKHRLLSRYRRDLQDIDADQRMHNVDVLAYQALTTRIRRKHHYDSQSIWKDPKVPVIEDVAYNAILMQNNHKIELIADTLGKTLPNQVQDSIERQKAGFAGFWDEDSQAYVNRNARTNEPIPIQTVSSLLPLYAYGGQDEPAPHLDQIIADLTDHNRFWTPGLVPSVPIDSEYYDAKRYWAGPRWSWINWLLEQGLRDHDYIDEANAILQANILLPIAEYTHAETGEPLGAFVFSGAAAIVLDSINRYRLYNLALAA